MKMRRQRGRGRGGGNEIEKIKSEDEGEDGQEERGEVDNPYVYFRAGLLQYRNRPDSDEKNHDQDHSIELAKTTLKIMI